MFQSIQAYLPGLWKGYARRQGIRILCYHGVVEHMKDARLERNFHLLDVFQEQVRFLRGFRVLSIAELGEELHRPVQRGKASRHPEAVITFDDGYANNLAAAEILERAHLPWSLFITTGAIGSGKPIWTIELALLMLHGEARQIVAGGNTWSLGDAEQRWQAYWSIRYRLKRVPTPQKNQEMDDIRLQFPARETTRLLDQYPSFQMLEWDQIAQLARSGVEIGSHGLHHEIHRADQPDAVRQEELVESKRVIEEKLGIPCRSFCFPNGRFISTSADEAQQTGYEMSFINQFRTVMPGANPHLLPRFDAVHSTTGFVRNFFWETSPNDA